MSDEHAGADVTAPPGRAAGRPGVVLAVDVGEVRVGVAACDPDRLVATPVETVARRRDGAGDADLRRVAELARERGAVEVVVGLPVGLSGREGPAAGKIRAWVDRLVPLLEADVAVGLVDERMTTAAAHRTLASAGVRARDRRSRVDQEAAVEILRTALASPRRVGAGA